MENTINIKAMSSGAEHNCSVPTKWRGKSLAVHRPIKDCKTNETHTQRCYWTVTHLETGLAAAFLHKPIREVIELAKAWDEAFTEIHSCDDVKDWEWSAEWRHQLHGSSPVCNPYSLEGVVKRYPVAA